MSMHKGLIGKSEGGASIKQDVTLKDYIQRKTENNNLPTSDQGWLHKLDMEKTAAWQQGYAQGKYRASTGELGISREMERRLIAEQWLIDRRIACPEAGYPSSEARFANVFEYVMYLESK